MDMYNYFVAHVEPGLKVSPSKVFYELKRWVSEASGKIDRCGGMRGNIIKYNEKKYVDELISGKREIISLYSERIWEKGDWSEGLNCDFSATYTSTEGIILSARGERMEVRELVDAFFEMISIFTIFTSQSPL